MSEDVKFEDTLLPHKLRLIQNINNPNICCMLIERMTEKYGQHIPPSSAVSPNSKLPVHCLSQVGPMSDADKTQTSSQMDLASSGVLREYLDQRQKILEVATSPNSNLHHNFIPHDNETSFIGSTSPVTPMGDLSQIHFSHNNQPETPQYDLQPAYFETLNSYGRQAAHHFGQPPSFAPLPEVRQPQLSHRPMTQGGVLSPARMSHSPYRPVRQLHTARRSKKHDCCSAEKLKVQHKRFSIEQTESQGRRMYEHYKKIEHNLKVKKAQREEELLREVRDKPKICKKSKQIIQRGLTFSDVKSKRHSECYGGIQSPQREVNSFLVEKSPIIQQRQTLQQQRTVDNRIHQTPSTSGRQKMHNSAFKKKKAFTPRNFDNQINKQFSSLKKNNEVPAGKLKNLCELYKIPVQTITSEETKQLDQIPNNSKLEEPAIVATSQTARHNPKQHVTTKASSRSKQLNKSTENARNASLTTINENINQSMQSVLSTKRQNSSHLFLPAKKKVTKNNLKVVKFVSAIPNFGQQPILKIKEYKPKTQQDHFQDILRKQAQPREPVKIGLNQKFQKNDTYERNLQWKNRQEQKRSLERMKQMERSFDECKFIPQIGQDPTRILSERSTISPMKSARQNKRYSEIHEQRSSQRPRHVRLPTHHNNFSYCSSPGCSRSPDHSANDNRRASNVSGQMNQQHMISFLTSQVPTSNIQSLASQYVNQVQPGYPSQNKSLFDISSMDMGQNQSQISSKSPFLSQFNRGSVGGQDSSQLDFTLNDDGSQTVTGGNQKVYFGGHMQKGSQIIYY